jgi:iron-sulfur cluster repair protein YtfE (RIC family)
MLTADHERVRDLFVDFDSNGPAMKKAIALQICQELDVHATLEEEIFYPAVREHGGYEGAEVISRAVGDHQGIKDLIGEIETWELSADSEAFTQLVHMLRNQIEQHVRLEEGRVFPIAEANFDVRQLAPMMDARRIALMTQRPTPRGLVLLLAGVVIVGLSSLLISNRRS